MLISLLDQLEEPGKVEETFCLPQSNYEKLTASITFNSERLDSFPLRSRTIKGCPLLPLVINIVLAVSVRKIRQGK